MKSFHILALCAALGALATANSSQAGTITAHYGALGGTNFEHVSMIYSGNSYSFPTAKAFGTRTDDAPAGAGVDTLIGHNFVAYCVETGQDLAGVCTVDESGTARRRDPCQSLRRRVPMPLY